MARYKRVCDLCGAEKPEFTVTSKHLGFILEELEDFDSSETAHITRHICTNCFLKIFNKTEENSTIEQNVGENRIKGGVLSLSIASKLTCYNCLRHQFCHLAEERENNPCNKISLSKESEEKLYRPFKNCSELINHCGTKNIWVKSKFDSNCVLQITGYSIDDEDRSVVWLTDSWITLEKLFDDWLFLDDSLCGVEE